MTDKLQEAVKYLMNHCIGSKTTRTGHIRTVLAELTRVQTEWGIYCLEGGEDAFVCQVPAQDNEDHSDDVLEAWRAEWQGIENPPEGMAVAIVTAELSERPSGPEPSFDTELTFVRWEEA